MPFARTGGLAVHYELVGPASAPTVMFAHSLGTNFYLWDPQIDALSREFRVLRYDLRGHGMTNCPDGEARYTIDQFADDSLALVEILGIEQVHFCGLSLGGMIGQRLAAKAPARVASLILCSTSSRAPSRALWDERIASIRSEGSRWIAQTLLARSFTPAFALRNAAVAGGIANMLMRTPADGYLGSCFAIHDADLRADDAVIRCPTLVIAGDQDVATPPAVARALCDAIDGARLEILAGAGHILTLEHPTWFNAMLVDFIRAPHPTSASGLRK